MSISYIIFISYIDFFNLATLKIVFQSLAKGVWYSSEVD